MRKPGWMYRIQSLIFPIRKIFNENEMKLKTL